MRKKKSPPPISENNILNKLEAAIAEFPASFRAAVCKRMIYSPEKYQEIKDKNIVLEDYWSSVIMDVFDDMWVDQFNKLQPYRSSLRIGFYATRTQLKPYAIGTLPTKYMSLLTKPIDDVCSHTSCPLKE